MAKETCKQERGQGEGDLAGRDEGDSSRGCGAWELGPLWLVVRVLLGTRNALSSPLRTPCPASTGTKS